MKSKMIDLPNNVSRGPFILRRSSGVQELREFRSTRSATPDQNPDTAIRCTHKSVLNS